jgi:hypothetical protein
MREHAELMWTTKSEQCSGGIVARRCLETHHMLYKGGDYSMHSSVHDLESSNGFCQGYRDMKTCRSHHIGMCANMDMGANVLSTHSK